MSVLRDRSRYGGHGSHLAASCVSLGRSKRRDLTTWVPLGLVPRVRLHLYRVVKRAFGGLLYHPRQVRKGHVQYFLHLLFRELRDGGGGGGLIGRRPSPYDWRLLRVFKGVGHEGHGVPIYRIVPLLVLVYRVLYLGLLLVGRLVSRLRSHLVEGPHDRSVGQLGAIRGLLVDHEHGGFEILRLRLPLLPSSAPPRGGPTTFPSYETRVQYVGPHGEGFPHGVYRDNHSRLGVPRLVRVRAHCGHREGHRGDSLFREPSLGELLVHVVVA